MSGSVNDSVPELRQKKGFINLLVRAATALVYVIAYIGALYFGGLTTAILLSIVAAFCAYEFFIMMKSEGKIANIPLGMLGAFLFPLAAHIWGQKSLTVIAGILIAISFIQYAFSLRARFSDISVTIMGALYTGFLLSNLVLIRDSLSGITGAYLVGLILVSVWANDSFAYLFGSMIGKHKMAPKISPKKSWEGFFAGVVGSTIIWALIPLIPGINLAWGWAILGGLACGVFGVIGDLMESRLKREAGVKDSGNLLPGHGGFLDRTDSMLLVSLVAFWVLRLGGVL